jgi:hypothetical protein
MAPHRVERRRLMSSPTHINESTKLELPGAWEPPDSSISSPVGEGEVVLFGFSYGNQTVTK